MGSGSNGSSRVLLVPCGNNSDIIIAGADVGGHAAAAIVYYPKQVPYPSGSEGFYDDFSDDFLGI